MARRAKCNDLGSGQSSSKRYSSQFDYDDSYLSDSIMDDPRYHDRLRIPSPSNHFSRLIDHRQQNVRLNAGQQCPDPNDPSRRASGSPTRNAQASAQACGACSPGSPNNVTQQGSFGQTFQPGQRAFGMNTLSIDSSANGPQFIDQTNCTQMRRANASPNRGAAQGQCSPGSPNNSTQSYMGRSLYSGPQNQTYNSIPVGSMPSIVVNDCSGPMMMSPGRNATPPQRGGRPTFNDSTFDGSLGPPRANSTQKQICNNSTLNGTLGPPQGNSTQKQRNASPSWSPQNWAHMDTSAVITPLRSTDPCDPCAGMLRAQTPGWTPQNVAHMDTTMVEPTPPPNDPRAGMLRAQSPGWTPQNWAHMNTSCVDPTPPPNDPRAGMLRAQSPGWTPQNWANMDTSCVDPTPPPNDPRAGMLRAQTPGWTPQNWANMDTSCACSGQSGNQSGISAGNIDCDKTLTQASVNQQAGSDAKNATPAGPSMAACSAQSARLMKERQPESSAALAHNDTCEDELGCEQAQANDSSYGGDLSSYAYQTFTGSPRTPSPQVSAYQGGPRTPFQTPSGPSSAPAGNRGGGPQMYSGAGQRGGVPMSFSAPGGQSCCPPGSGGGAAGGGRIPMWTGDAGGAGGGSGGSGSTRACPIRPPKGGSPGADEDSFKLGRVPMAGKNVSLSSSIRELCNRQKRKEQVDNLVMDQCDPGIIQDTLDGYENFNCVSLEVTLGNDTPDKRPQIEPLSLVEAFHMRIMMSREKVKCVKERTPEPDESSPPSSPAEESKKEKTFIDKYFASQPESEINKIIKAYLKAEKADEITNVVLPQFTTELSKKETTLPGSELNNFQDLRLITYTSTTKPA